MRTWKNEQIDALTKMCRDRDEVIKYLLNRLGLDDEYPHTRACVTYGYHSITGPAHDSWPIENLLRDIHAVNQAASAKEARKRLGEK